MKNIIAILKAIVVALFVVALITILLDAPMISVYNGAWNFVFIMAALSYHRWIAPRRTVTEHVVNTVKVTVPPNAHDILSHIHTGPVKNGSTTVHSP